MELGAETSGQFKDPGDDLAWIAQLERLTDRGTPPASPLDQGMRSLGPSDGQGVIGGPAVHHHDVYLVSLAHKPFPWYAIDGMGYTALMVHCWDDHHDLAYCHCFPPVSYLSYRDVPGPHNPGRSCSGRFLTLRPCVGFFVSVLYKYVCFMSIQTKFLIHFSIIQDDSYVDARLIFEQLDHGPRWSGGPPDPPRAVLSAACILPNRQVHDG
jgi:hypothetical protein